MGQLSPSLFYAILVQDAVVVFHVSNVLDIIDVSDVFKLKFAYSCKNHSDQPFPKVLTLVMILR